MDISRKRVGLRSFLTLALATVALSGCDSLLEVDLPSQLGDDAITDPAGAETQINSMIAHFENGYDQWVWEAFGRDDGGESKVCSGGYSHCNNFTYGIAMTGFADFAKSRSFAYGLYDKLDKTWTVAQVPLRERYMAISALYAGANLNIMASSLCEVTVNAGPLLTPVQALTEAETWLTKALGHIQTTGDFGMPHGVSGSATTGARALAYGLRAQVRWMKGDLAGASADAALVPQGFRGVVAREATPDRRNRPYYAGTVTRYLELSDVNDWWTGPANPVTGQAWGKPIPFTGYRELGIMADGRAVRDNGIPIRLLGNYRSPEEIATPPVKDTRVQTAMGVVFARSTVTYVFNKYASEADDEPIVNWKEMVLIRAEAAATPQGTIDLVNSLRAADNLPLVTYITGATATTLQMRQLLIEERRRVLYGEGRYLFTKFKNLDLTWFPRAVGNYPDSGLQLTGGIRWLMPDAEYQLNTNLGMEKRATGCAASEKPVNF